jgi:hypothetical protein
MAAAAFTKFDPRAFLEREARTEGTPAKVAKVAKIAERSGTGAETLAGLATLAAPLPRSENCELTPEPWTDAHDERAAIAEYDGGAPRAWAEGFARLDPSRPPADVPAKRWLRFIDDCGRFLDGRWPAKAADFGWGPLDLFGCDRERPFARIDHLGLLWLIDGRKLVALTKDTATVQSATGTHQTHYRRPVQVGRVVLAWDLTDA